MTRQEKMGSIGALDPALLRDGQYAWRRRRLPDLLVSWLAPEGWRAANELPDAPANQLQPLMGLVSPDLDCVATLSVGRTSDSIDGHEFLARAMSFETVQGDSYETASASVAEATGFVDGHSVFAAVHRVALARGYANFLATFACPQRRAPELANTARVLMAGMRAVLNQQHLGGTLRG